MKSLHMIFLIALLGIAPRAPAQQSNGKAGAFLRLGAGARAEALGGAYTGYAADPSAIFWNAAGLAVPPVAGVVLGHNQLLLERNLNYVAGRLPWGGTRALGFGWMGLQVGNIEARSGNSPEPDYLFSDAENAFFLSFAQQLAGGLYMGSTLKLLSSRLANRSATGTGFDFSLLASPGQHLRVGLAVLNIGGHLKWETGYKDFVPMTMRGGLSYLFMEKLRFNLDAFAARGDALQIVWGAEANPLGLLPLRAGLSEGGLVGGFGMKLPTDRISISLDYAMARDGVGGEIVHKFSLGFDFPPGRKPATERPPLPRRQERATAIAPAAPRFSQLGHVRVSADLLNVRRGPGTSYPIIEKVARGAVLTNLDFKRGWYEVRLPSGEIGWVHGNYVKEVP